MAGCPWQLGLSLLAELGARQVRVAGSNGQRPLDSTELSWQLANAQQFLFSNGVRLIKFHAFSGQNEPLVLLQPPQLHLRSRSQLFLLLLTSLPRPSQATIITYNTAVSASCLIAWAVFECFFALNISHLASQPPTHKQKMMGILNSVHKQQGGPMVASRECFTGRVAH